MPPYRPTEDRFWDKVDKNGPIPAHVPDIDCCWVWAGAKNTGGYGNFSTYEGKTLKTHRVAWMLTNGGNTGWKNGMPQVRQ